MILTVTLNPSVDKTYVLPGFDPGGINTVHQAQAVAGGKGNNVARVLRVLGHPVRATGFLAGDSGRWLDRALTAEGVDSRFLAVPGETRTCLALIDPQVGRVGEIREPGPSISAADQERLLAQLPELAASCSFSVVSGSLPVGVAPAYLAAVVGALRAAGLSVLLDAKEPALEAALQAGPSLIKPNQEELSGLLRRPVAPEEAPAAAREAARAWGVRVVVSLGPNGAAAADPDGSLFIATPPPVKAVNTVGAGDSMSAGLASALSQGADLAAALRMGIACGTASVLTEGVGMVRLADVTDLLPKVTLSTENGTR
ncbi:MAG: 1-phosphofructokinase family hexose kinase [Bacillota bacterium]